MANSCQHKKMLRKQGFIQYLLVYASGHNFFITQLGYITVNYIYTYTSTRIISFCLFEIRD